MSLLTNPRHTVTVTDRVESIDSDGAVSLAKAPPLVVRCNVHPVTADEAERYGLVLTDSYRVTARDWPGGPNALVEWDGETFSQVGRVLKSRMGAKTQHDRVFIRRGQTSG